jgi:ribosomal protein S4
MCCKIIKGRNYKKYKLLNPTKINTSSNLYIHRKLTKKKWYFFRFNNSFSYFPRVRKISKLRFFYKNNLNIRRILRLKNSYLRCSTLYKIYLKSSKANPRYLGFINLLESRLDVCLFRTGLFSSPISLRQFILHKNIYLNGNLVTKPGIFLKKNDLIQLNPIKLNYYTYVKSLTSSFDHLSHLEIDLRTCSFIYLGFFTLSDLVKYKKQDLAILNYIFKF